MFFQKIKAIFEWISARRMKQSRKVLDYPWTTHQSIRTGAPAAGEKTGAGQQAPQAARAPEAPVSGSVRKPEAGAVEKSAGKSAGKPAARAPEREAAGTAPSGSSAKAGSAARTRKKARSAASSDAAAGLAPAPASDAPGEKPVETSRARRDLRAPKRAVKVQIPKPPAGALPWGESSKVPEKKGSKLSAASPAAAFLAGRRLKDVREPLLERYPEVARLSRSVMMVDWLSSHEEARGMLAEIFNEQAALERKKAAAERRKSSAARRKVAGAGKTARRSKPAGDAGAKAASEDSGGSPQDPAQTAQKPAA